ncbi:hypothetical protein [Nocardiopsis sp. NPDC058789]|uniref:hypothetical protein n=1 Tax=Nocardiopsis sp. NPDC058789 TaxID=3346634 RepID=UPI00366BD4B8
MIPAHWTAHHREEDGEVLGYLRPEGGGAYVPVNPFGQPLGHAASEHEARGVLDDQGLASLAELWHMPLPGRAEPVTVRIVEVTPEHVRVANADYGFEEADIGHVFVLDVPARLQDVRGGVQDRAVTGGDQAEPGLGPG